MNKLLRAPVSLLRHNIAVAGISTNPRLFAQPASENTSGENADKKKADKQNTEKKNSNSKILGIIGLAGILGGIAFAYYEYQLINDLPKEPTKEKPEKTAK